MEVIVPVVTKRSEKTPVAQELKQRLIEEWKGAGTRQPLPTIVHEEDERGDVVHVYVVWDEWRELNQEERSAIITDAYWEVFQEKGLALTVAMGLTSEEAQRMKLQLPSS
jgi:hypothetical protein